MKIGIVTQPLYDNYGGILQNWALQRVLYSLGHDPITIDYLPKQSYLRNILSRIKFHLKKLWGTSPKKPIREHVRNQQFEKFVRKNLITTTTCHAYNHSIIDKYSIDMICIGSDQVWRPKYNGYVLYDMYGKFARPTPAFTYAASFGVDKWEYSAKQTRRCRLLAKTLKGISVREKDAVEICKTHLGICPQFVIDPTLVLSKSEYETLVDGYPFDEEPYLLAYILDNNEEKQTIINSLAEKKHLQIHLISIYDKESKTIEAWLKEFRDASFVVTDSYHGTVFSVIFQKNFKLLANQRRGIMRFKSLLEICGLENKIDERETINPINWDVVEKKLSSYRNTSLDYLRLLLK